MASYNKSILIGNLGRDPEVKTFDSGGKVAVFSLATSESWKSKDGTKQEKTHWHTIVVKNNSTVDFVEKYIRKSSNVLVEGQLTYRDYMKDGQKKYVTEVVVGPYGGELKLLDKKPSSEFSDEIPF